MANILIVDDEESLRRVMTRHFRRRGHTVTEIADFSQVRDTFDARRFDVIFLDICMPGMNGDEVCAALRIAPRRDDFELVQPPPIILMTGYHEYANFNFTRRCGDGVYCCMTKPFSLQEADEAMRCCLEDEGILRNAFGAGTSEPATCCSIQ